ncbi:GTPase Era [Desulforhopalus vacuolatus]|uniref:GTPase Era n=1 Tax=Desulforhopalus vacuolatus TaxID=40414 RepID=UPI00196520FB|nr:GTPase Era [Desulforhopalus vacuolatus]MBM9519580.1 GTPase Era [Desulforhopalus vacuolatus]
MEIKQAGSPAEPVHSGMTAIVGPPNAGKSTLMNAFLRQKISIVSPKPQTTRNRIAGIVNGDDYQVVFLDTPGLHQTREALNTEMVRVALESLSDVDLVLFLMDVSLPTPEKVQAAREKEMSGWLAKMKSPAILVLNKVDLIAREKLLPLIAAYQKLFSFTEIIPVSAKDRDGVDLLLETIIKKMPLGPRYFPEDIPTNASERFLCAEIIREKVFLQINAEIPYSTAVVIEAFQEEKNRVLIHATIVIERPSQKGIIIGKGGTKLKSIGIAARKDIEKLLGQKVRLELWVKVKKNWSQDSQFMREQGF